VTQYLGPGYGVDYPAGWHVVAAERPIATFFRTEFASPDGHRLIIIDRSPGEALPPLAKAMAVMSATARTPGYHEVAFFATTLRGRNVPEWQFLLSGQPAGTRVDIFEQLNGSGFAVLGEAQRLGDILSITRQVAASLNAR
jgi:hypothetical protein